LKPILPLNSDNHDKHKKASKPPKLTRKETFLLRETYLGKTTAEFVKAIEKALHTQLTLRCDSGTENIFASGPSPAHQRIIVATGDKLLYEKKKDCRGSARCKGNQGIV